MAKYQAKDLISRYVKEETSNEENLLVEQWFNEYLKSSDSAPSPERLKAATQETRTLLLQHIQKEKKGKPVFRMWWRISAVAAVFLLFIGLGYLFNVRQRVDRTPRPFAAEFAPASNKAVLTLANGKKIIINAAPSGKLALQGKVSIDKTGDADIAYTAAGPATGGPVDYNTIENPRGGRQFHLLLSDGTSVLLNAASSLHYPASFTTKDRIVELKGEAYFEVTHDQSHPFRVLTNGQVVEDLGTRFNIKAYADEFPARTTLLQGSISISRGKEQAILTPGQQAIINPALPAIRTVTADLDEVMAWKNNEFYFSDTDLHMAMMQLSRWYDVDISYKQDFPKVRLSGTFPRNMSSTKALKLLEYLLETSKVKFRTEGREIIVE